MRDGVARVLAVLFATPSDADSIVVGQVIVALGVVWSTMKLEVTRCGFPT